MNTPFALGAVASRSTRPRRNRLRSTILIAGLAIVAFCSHGTRAEDLQRLYDQSDKDFFVRWNIPVELAVRCADFADTTQFLEEALKTLGIVEVTEGNAEVIETLRIEQPVCLLNAFAALEPTRQRAALRFLVFPLMHESDELAAALSPHWTTGRHRHLYDWYLEARSDGERFQEADEALSRPPA